jgi:hypothetical protein
MIVYGDTRYEVDGSKMIALLASRLQRSRRCVSTWLLQTASSCERVKVLDSARQVLISAGELEQAVADAAEDQRLAHSINALAEALHELTQCAGDLFFKVWTLANAKPDGETPSQSSSMADVLHLFDKARNQLKVATLLMGRVRRRDAWAVKIPEGFAFYALFPEQYATASQEWLNAHQSDPSKRAVVAGIRTIGTTLCAVVGAALRAAGWHAFTLTVRPQGSRYAREAILPALIADPTAQVIIVDEGPGLSGSSMAAVAEAFSSAGFADDHISFLPGHANLPGMFGSQAARDWWQRTPRHVCALEQTQMAGGTLADALAEATCVLTGESQARIWPAAAGLWRNWTYGSAHDEWPAVCAPFERPKHIVKAGDVTLIWKFAGLCQEPSGCDGVEAALTHLTRRAQHGWGPLPVAHVHGHVALPWVRGRPLRIEDADDVLLKRVGEYIASLAGDAMAPEAQHQTMRRLHDMLVANTREALGDSCADKADRLARATLAESAMTMPQCGDGRLAPHEWRLVDGRLMKVGGMGHRPDHTIIGVQPIVWDIAGALVEWRAGHDFSRVVFDGFTEAGGDPSPIKPVLPFYRAAYAGFKMGQCVFSADACDDAQERSRLARAAAFYCDALVRALA